MQRNSGARFFPLFITLVIVIVAVIAVVSIGRALFFSGDSSNTTSEERDIGRDSLLNTNAGREVKLTVRGPIVAEEQFMSYTIEASPTSRAMIVYNGYLDDVTDRKSYDNNTRAYEQFVFALDKANMMKGETASDEEEDLRGICATGYVYEYATVLNGENVKRLWTSTCNGSKGTLDASTAQLNNLYQKQIPDFKDLIPFQQSPLQGLQL